MNKYVVYAYSAILFSFKKRKSCHYVYNTNGSVGYYAKYKKPDAERHILYDLTYIWNLKYLMLWNQRLEW